MQPSHHPTPIFDLGKRIACLSAALMLGAAMAQAQDQVVFDNVSNFENGVAGAGLSAASTVPNTFMGDGYTLAAGTTNISGFDLFAQNNSGKNYVGLEIDVYIWGSVNTGTVNANTPAFSNLLATRYVRTAGTFTNGFRYSFESGAPGVIPGLSLDTPLAIPEGAVGITVSYLGTTDGTTYSYANSLTSNISYGTAPTVGSLTLGNGYYRNANAETNGNFTSTLRTFTVGGAAQTNEGVAMRIYSTVPEPGTWALLVVGAGAVLAWRVRRGAFVARV